MRVHQRLLDRYFDGPGPLVEWAAHADDRWLRLLHDDVGSQVGLVPRIVCLNLVSLFYSPFALRCLPRARVARLGRVEEGADLREMLLRRLARLEVEKLLARRLGGVRLLLTRVESISDLHERRDARAVVDHLRSVGRVPHRVILVRIQRAHNVLFLLVSIGCAYVEVGGVGSVGKLDCTLRE